MRCVEWCLACPRSKISCVRVFDGINSSATVRAHLFLLSFIGSHSSFLYSITELRSVHFVSFWYAFVCHIREMNFQFDRHFNLSHRCGGRFLDFFWCHFSWPGLVLLFQVLQSNLLGGLCEISIVMRVHTSCLPKKIGKFDWWMYFCAQIYRCWGNALYSNRTFNQLVIIQNSNPISNILS